MKRHTSSWFALTGDALADRLAAIHGEATIAKADGRIPQECSRRRPLNNLRRDAIRGPPPCGGKVSACWFLKTTLFRSLSRLPHPKRKLTMLENTSREVVTLMLLQEDKDAAIAESRTLRKRLQELKEAVDELDWAINVIKSSPLRRMLGDTQKPQLEAAIEAMPLRSGLLARLLKAPSTNGK